jgi:hypothetical protein
VNPFEYVDPVAPEALLDRDRELRALVDRAVEGRNSRVVGPRRFGKTSLVLRALAELDRDGLHTVYVNFFGVLTPADVAERIERAYGDQLSGRLAAWFQAARRGLRPTLGVRAGVPGASGEVTVSRAPAATEPALLERLALPRRLFEQEGRRVVVVFDEFQDVLTAGEHLDAAMRSELEQHRDAAAYIFAGSHVGMMRELFASKRRAFYAQAAPVDLGPLAPEDIAEAVHDRFAAGGRTLTPQALGLLLDTARGHPQRTMLLAHVMWARVDRGSTVDETVFAAALDQVLRVEARDELRAVWTGMPDTQRRVVTAVAENSAGLYSNETRRRVGGGRGGYLRQAVRALIDAGELVEDSATATGHRLVDPMFELWVRERRAFN